MKHIFFAIALLFIFSSASAQDASVKEMHQQALRNGKDDPAKTNDSAWKTGVSFSLSFAQGGSRNWAAGAEKFSVSLAAYASFFANKKIGKWDWNNTLDLGYALVNTTSQGVRKNDDKIDLFSKIGTSISNHMNFSIVGNLRSQFTNGYNYNYLGKGYRHRTSGFMAPGYLTLAPGFDWKPNDYFSVFFSPVSARFILVTQLPKGYYFQGGIIPAQDGGGYELPMSTLYGVDPEKMMRFELGGFASMQFNKEVLKNVNYKFRMDLYANYLSSSRFVATGPDQVKVISTEPRPGNVDVFWTNTIGMKVNKWLQVSYNFDLIYDDDVRQFGPQKDSPGTQLRSLLGVGIAAKF
jgi:hypothetical protein